VSTVAGMLFFGQTSPLGPVTASAMGPGTAPAGN
jgi:hypothetical protein